MRQIQPYAIEDIRYAKSFWTWFCGFLPCRIVVWILVTFVLCPVHYLYFEGPSIRGYGFWAGRTYEDICHELSGFRVKSEFWVSSDEAMAECSKMTSQAFNQFILLWGVLFYMIILFITIYFAVKTISHAVTTAGTGIYDLILERTRRDPRRSPYRRTPPRP